MSQEDLKFDSPEAAETFAVSWFAPMWSFAGETPHWPISRATLAKLCVAGHYATSAEHIGGLMEQGHVPTPPQTHGRDMWGPVDAIRVVDWLERAEHWKWVPSVHDSKKTQIRRDAEIAELRGDVDTLVEGLDNWTPLQIIDLIVKSDDAENRRTLRDVLMLNKRLWWKKANAEQQAKQAETEDEFDLGFNSWKEVAE